MSFDITPTEIKLDGKLLVARWVQAWASASRPDAARWAQHCTEKMMVCGIGGSGKPSCTPPIALRDGGCKGTDKPASIEWDWSLDVRLLPDGKLQVQPKSGDLPDSAKALAGAHPLAFP